MKTPIIILIFAFQFSSLLNPGFYEDSIMGGFQKVQTGNDKIIQYERYGEPDVHINILEQDLEIIKIYFNSKDDQIIDSCSYAFYSIYEKDEEYASGDYSHQSSKMLLEYATYSQLNKKLHYEKMETNSEKLETVVVESVNPKSINIEYLRKLCTEGSDTDKYKIWRKENVRPNWE